LRNNRVSDADGACIQMNADPESYEAGEPNLDGHMSRGLVEGNVLFDCGDPDTGGGGAALNLAGVTDTTFRNNLIYGQPLTGGIANWDDGFGIQFGCTGNTFVNNTIDCRSCDRHAVSFRNGSTGNTFINNIVLTSDHNAVAIDPESFDGTQVNGNVYALGVFFEDTTEDYVDLAEWQTQGLDSDSVAADPTSLFVDLAANDYHLAAGSVALDRAMGIDVTTDIEGVPRPQGAASDVGAYERP
jgi:hypothetical protein